MAIGHEDTGLMPNVMLGDASIETQQCPNASVNKDTEADIGI